MRQLALTTLFGLVALAGCSDKPYDPNAPAIDPNAPRVHIVTPAVGTIAGDVHTVTVSGTASDDTGVTSVTVNDVPATLSPDGSWTAQIPVAAGTTLIHAIAKDAQGNAGKESRAVVAGPMADLAQQVPQAITATLSAQTFSAIGKGTAGFLTSGDLASMLGTAPVMDLGGGPDCLYAKAWITSVTFGGADVTLAPQDGGLWLDVELDQANIGMHLEYAAACVDGSRDITVAASHISVTGNMTVGVAGNDFDIHLDSPNVSITGFDAELGGIPGAIVDLLSLDTAMGPVLGWATEKFVVPMLNKSLAGLNNTKTMDVLGTMVDISVKPDDIQFSSQGAVVVLDTSLRAHGDSGTFVFTDNTVPAMDLSHGFQMAVADDAANQLFTSLWSAKALDKTLDLKNGSYGEIGTLYDSVEISAAVPPFVDASGKGLVLTVGDLIATFKNGGQVVTKVAINAQVDLQVVNAPTGGIRFDVGTPTTYVDVIDEGVEGANQLSNAEFEAIASFALSRVIAVGSGSVGAIPLPAVGGVSVQNLTIAEQTGYLVVDGEVQ
jgi:hypothetical protein